MSHSDEHIRRQLGLGEDSRWEFKRVEFAGDRPRSPSRDEFADEIAAFANAQGGFVLCGVSDEGEVQDMSRAQMVALDELLVEVNSDAIKPPVRIQVHHRHLPGSGRLLLVDVPQGDFQHDSPGGSYVRVGGSKRRMTSDERLRPAQRRGQAAASSYDERTVAGTGFNTLDEALWKPLLSAEGAANPQVALQKMALLSVDEGGIPRATVAGILLCARSAENFLPNAASPERSSRSGPKVVSCRLPRCWSCFRTGPGDRRRRTMTARRSSTSTQPTFP